VRIVDERMLIFNQEGSSKAVLSYDLRECEIKGKVVEEAPSRAPVHPRLSHSNLRRSSQSHNKSLSFDNVYDKANSSKEYHNMELIKQLNYVVDIEHPYLQNCSLKCNDLIDSMEFYNEIITLI
jgi:hypothetical protein